MKTMSRMLVLLALLVAGTAVGGYAQENQNQRKKKRKRKNTWTRKKSTKKKRKTKKRRKAKGLKNPELLLSDAGLFPGIVFFAARCN